LLPYFNETNLCSGELLNNKFIVPCNPEFYLSKQYGEDRWKIPLTDKYFNYDSISFYKNWTNDEWPYAVRYYDLVTGDISVERTLEELNRHVDEPYTNLPEDFI
jgi:hypothetical protein